jgi:hypothetical protein
MSPFKKMALALLASAAIVSCKKTVLTEDTIPTEGTDRKVAVASSYRIMVNGVLLGPGITGYQTPLAEGSVILVDAQAFLERLGYGLFLYSPSTQTFSTQRRSASSTFITPNNAPNAATALWFTNGSAVARVQARNSSTQVNITMPAPATYTAGGRMMVPAIWLAQQAGIPVKLIEDDRDSQSIQCYYYEECDFGLYFLGSQSVTSTDAIGSEKFVTGTTNRFFNSSRPTIIYVHGWQPNGVRDFNRENLLLNQGGQNVHTQNAWISAGWNVAIFNWIQLADDDYAAALLNKPDTVEAKIYTPSFAGIGMRWRRTDNSLVTSHPSTPRKSVAGLLADEINKIRAANPNVELRIVGNSLGGNLTMAAISAGVTTMPVTSGPANVAITKAPERVVLMDPYWCRSDLAGNSIVNNVTFAENSGAAYAALPNSAMEYYRTSVLGLNGYNRGLARFCAYLNFIPGFTSDIGQKHTVPVRQYFHSFSMTNSATPLERLETGLFSNERAMSAQTSNARIRNMMLQTNHWEHEAASGSNTATFQDDVYRRVLGDPQ